VIYAKNKQVGEQFLRFTEMHMTRFHAIQAAVDVEASTCRRAANAPYTLRISTKKWAPRDKSKRKIRCSSSKSENS